MGRIYIPWASIYVIPEEWHGSAIAQISWVDAFSLEEIPHNQKMDRLLASSQVPGISDADVVSVNPDTTAVRLDDIFKLEVPEWQRN